MSKRVFQLRKRIEAESVAAAEVKERQTQQQPLVMPPPNTNILDNKSQLTAQRIDDRNDEQQEQNYNGQSGPRLLIDKNYLHFQKLVSQVDIKQVKITNTGSSSIYYEWVRVQRHKINTNAILDEACKFFCHHQKNVIKPGERINFVFSFISKIPGIFIEQFEFKCQPPLLNPLGTLKLQGKAIIPDQYEVQRKNFTKQLSNAFLEKTVKELVEDLVNSVKAPEDPRPDMSDPAVAAKQFQKINENYGVIYNNLIFSWWNGLYQQLCDIINLPAEQRYWGGDINQLRGLINRVEDECKRQSLQERLAHYLHVSKRKSPEKSPVYDQIRKILCRVAMGVIGQFNDSARKELDMWEVVWREPQTTDTQADKKARDDELAKIKADWVKKAKKKKWGQEEEKALMTDYRGRVESKAKEAFLTNFEQLDNAADFIRTDEIVKNPPLTRKYFRWLQRLKTVKESQLEGQRVVLKTQLRLKQGGINKLTDLRAYLLAKKEYERRLEEEKKEQESKDKKKTKKTTKKKEEQLIAPQFDIMQVLDEQSLKDIIESLKYIQDKSPKIIILAVSFGDKLGSQQPQYSLQFLLDYLKSAFDPSIVLLPLKEIPSLAENIQNDGWPQGSIMLLENINFLPYEATFVRTQTSFQRLLMEQITEGTRTFQLFTDIMVNDNKDEVESGLATYLRKQCVLGLSWWRIIGITLKAEDADWIIGGKLTPQIINLIEASVWLAKRVFILGQVGVKMAMAANNKTIMCGITLTSEEQRALKNLQSKRNMEWEPHLPKHKRAPEPARAQFILPIDILAEEEAAQETIAISDAESKKKAIQVGNGSIERLLQYVQSSKKLFIIGQLSLTTSQNLYQHLFRYLYRMKEARVARHAEQHKKGIDYRQDTIVTMVGNYDSIAQQVQLKDKKPKNEEDEEEQKPEDEEGQQPRNLTLIQDFHTDQNKYVQKLLCGQYSSSLSNIGKFPKADD